MLNESLAFCDRNGTLKKAFDVVMVLDQYFEAKAIVNR